MLPDTWFQVRLVAPQTWAIDDNGNSIIYLLVGSERALLLDTGWGVGDLPTLVSSITSLPLTVVNTHGHPDHTFGNGRFPLVHIHPGDAPMVEQPPALETRRWIASDILGPGLPVGFDIETWAASVPELHVLHDSQSFDLGGRTLQVIALPGHSSGSICLLDRATNLLFTGDSVLAGTIWLHLDESLPLQTFLEHLRQVQMQKDAFDGLLPSHGDLSRLPLPTTTLDDLVAGIQRILQNEIAGSEEHTFAGDGLRCDFETCGIVYRADRMH